MMQLYSVTFNYVRGHFCLFSRSRNSWH